MKAIIILSMVLQFDFLYVSILRTKNVYFTAQLNGVYAALPTNQVMVPAGPIR